MESLNFDKLVTSYYENLNTKLRNFYAGPEFLDSWVHDENLNRSLLGVFESAHDNGVDELSVEISAKLSQEVDVPLLKTELTSLGSPEIEETKDGIRVSLRKIHPSYQKALNARKIQFEGPLPSGIRAREGQLELGVEVDAEGIVTEAKHTGGLGFFRALLDTLCEALKGRPLQEGRDHALIRLEATLRDRTVPPPVKGLVTPKNCEPSFRVLESLLRKLGNDSDARNEWVDPVSPSWKELPFEQQKQKIHALFQGTDLEVLEIRGQTRVVLSGNAFRLRKNAGHEMMVLEKKAKETLEPNLEFVMESLEDKNQRELR